MNPPSNLHELLVRWNPTIELVVAILCFIGFGIIYRDIILMHRKTRTSWSNKQVQACLIPIGAGLLFLVFFFLE